MDDWERASQGQWDSNHHQRLIDELIESFSAQPWIAFQKRLHQ